MERVRKACNTSMHLIVAATTVGTSSEEADFVTVCITIASKACIEEKRPLLVHGNDVGGSNRCAHTVSRQLGVGRGTHYFLEGRFLLPGAFLLLRWDFPAAGISSHVTSSGVSSSVYLYVERRAVWVPSRHLRRKAGGALPRDVLSRMLKRQGKRMSGPVPTSWILAAARVAWSSASS